MAMLVSKEDRKIIKDEWLADNAIIVFHIEKQIAKYLNSLSDLKMKIAAKALFNSAQKIEKIASALAWVLATAGDGSKPIQSIAGMFRKTITIDDSIEQDILAFQFAMEILFFVEPVAKVELSRNGHYMVVSAIYDENLETINSYLPLTKPSFQHNTLGNFHWKNNVTEPMDRLAKVPFNVIAVEEEDIEFPHPNDYSVEGMKQREQATKQFWRRAIAKNYADKDIYFSWSSDYRGRMYSTGYWVNLQGTEVEKAMIELANKKKLDWRGEMELAAYITAVYGLDKKTRVEKLEWFKENEHQLESLVFEAEEPYLYQYAINAWKNRDKESGVLVEIDSTQSQIQMLSVLLHSEDIAKICNVIGSMDNKADAWQAIADEMGNILHGNVTRKQVKKSAMILLYGAGKKRIKQQLSEDFNIKDPSIIYEVFMMAVENIFPGMVTLMEFINSLWQEEWREKTITMPDGFKMTMKPTGSEWNEFKLFGTIPITAKVTGVEQQKSPLFVFVNLIHAMDSYVMRELIRRTKGINLYTIHDAVRCHPNDVHIVKNVYKEILAEVNKMDILGDFISQMIDEKITLPTAGLNSDDIKKSHYAIS